MQRGIGPPHLVIDTKECPGKRLRQARLGVHHITASSVDPGGVPSSYAFTITRDGLCTGNVTEKLRCPDVATDRPGTAAAAPRPATRARPPT